MKLFDFIEGAIDAPIGKSAFVDHNGFSEVYARVTPRAEVIQHLYKRGDASLGVDLGAAEFDVSQNWHHVGMGLSKTIVLARVFAASPGRGAWRQLVCDLRERWPKMPILVECVQSPSFAKHLARHGWRYAEGPHYWLAPEDPNPYAVKEAA